MQEKKTKEEKEPLKKSKNIKIEKEPMKIIVTGFQHSGKSSFLNALGYSLDKNIFKYAYFEIAPKFQLGHCTIDPKHYQFEDGTLLTDFQGLELTNVSAQRTSQLIKSLTPEVKVVYDNIFRGLQPKPGEFNFKADNSYENFSNIAKQCKKKIKNLPRIL